MIRKTKKNLVLGNSVIFVVNSFLPILTVHKNNLQMMKETEKFLFAPNIQRKFSTITETDQKLIHAKDL